MFVDDGFEYAMRNRGYCRSFVERVRAKRRRWQVPEKDAQAPGLIVSQDEVASLRQRGFPGWARQIVAAVCEQHDVAVEVLIGQSRHKLHIKARWDALYRIKAAKPAASYPLIARWFKRDHTAVLYAVEAHALRNGLPSLIKSQNGKATARYARAAKSAN